MAPLARSCILSVLDLRETWIRQVDSYAVYLLKCKGFMLSHWFSGHGLFVCRVFLWDPGRGLQKTFQGSLRSLVHQLLITHQWLIEAVVSDERWSIACAVEDELDWTTRELKMVTEACIQRIATTRKVILLVDGLDELKGTDDDRYDTLTFLQTLANFESVKFCVSSRPWNTFSDYFLGLPQLQI